MSNEDDADELEHKGLNELFQRGFTVPPALRMNSVYGKYATAANHTRTTAAIAQAYFIAKNACGVMRVI